MMILIRVVILSIMVDIDIFEYKLAILVIFIKKQKIHY